ncbi:hypothetical protein QTL95_21770 [Rhizobium sp. S152]|uniref:hypothetical protein n=1 Tax=Rhizobium sp. S152 TaxID=3055038 RepID=UPI0025AA2612|nr:hypothetical protein [Rhizobium sp. S152]MDM9628530.1 hypothetical protein [Rhizobium sp. S152]
MIDSPNFVEISLAARSIKSQFDSPPDEVLIREIKDHIAATGETWTWWGHTHTNPAPGSNVYYADTFDIPRQARAAKLWIPCPCCSPNHRKFGSGVIAYFPDEKVIRLIGPKCFATLNAAGHEEAMEGLRRRTKERQSLNYILNRIHKMPEWLEVANEVFEAARAADIFFAVLSNRIEVSLDVPLWRQVRNGTLDVREEISDYRFENGKMVEFKRKIASPLFRLEGHTALNPDRRPKAPQLVKAMKEFAPYAAMTDEAVRGAPHMQRVAAVKEVKNFLGKVQRIKGELDEELKLVRPINMQRLGQWAADSRSAIDLRISRVSGSIELSGRREYVVPIPEALRDIRLPDIRDDLQ